MLPKLAIVLVLCLVGTFVGAQNAYTRTDRTKIRNRYAFTAVKGLISSFSHHCIDNTQHFDQTNKHEKTPSIETLIELVERLEDIIANTTEYSQFNSPDKVARMILHRFHLDSVDFSNMEQVQYVDYVSRIDSEIMGKAPGPDEYYFPDNIYNDKELCTMLFMFSHIFLNNSRAIQQSARVGRATYQYQRSQTANPTNPINSGFLEGSVTLNPIQEKGIVSFRLDSKEAIAPAKVLAGIIAGMTDTSVTSGKAISQKLSPNSIPMTEEVTLTDPLLAVTFGSMMGPASFYEFSSTNGLDQGLIYGVQGSWVNSTCCTYYGIEGVTDPRALRRSNRGSLAQIRGALDGYIIGRNLKTIGKSDAQQLKLSIILKSYYSWPHVTTGKKYGLSYCDRRDNRPNSQDIANVGNAYNQIYNYVAGTENSAYKGDLINTFVDKAASNLQEFCNKRPTGTLDRNSPKDTPADLIFIIDPKSEEMSKTAELVNAVIARVNKIGRYAGAVSVFVNSNTRNDIEGLPAGPGGWPLPALVYNSTNIGEVGCQLKPNTPFGAQTLLGKYLQNVNTTLFNYKWWSRKSYTGVPSKNVILIDYGSLVMPTSGTDKNDFDTYKDELYWRNRDTKFIVVSPKPEFFKDFIGEQNEVLSPQGSVTTIATSIASRIAENPATLTYNDCMAKTVKNTTFEGFVSVGSQYRLALYPEYFKVSSEIEFTIKATEGGIHYCYDRVFPPEEQKQCKNCCKDLAENAVDTFKYWGPCEGHTVHTCKPLYFTIWGKERTTLCKDIHCQSLDQAKFTIDHSGSYCSSSLRLSSALFLQIICISLIAIFSFKWASV